MEHFASNIKIQNFKSIEELELNDCKRINLLIGKPNVGKSNILEAMSLFSLPYLAKSNRNLKDLIRFKNLSEIYFDGNITNSVNIYIDDNHIFMDDLTESIFIDYSGKDRTISYDSDLVLHIKKVEKDRSLKFEEYEYKNYLFPKEITFDKYPYQLSFLQPVNGGNLFDVVQYNKDLKEEFLALFQTYGLHLVFDKSSQELKVMKGVEKGEIFLIPFSSIADSLQRLIFYKTAIKSNTNSVITFEEPEAHTYPPYIAQIAHDVIDAKTNQFFITTHSPYVVNELLENAQDELAIYMVDFKDGQTVARRLTSDELDEVYNDGIDLFFNNEFFA